MRNSRRTVTGVLAAVSIVLAGLTGAAGQPAPPGAAPTATADADPRAELTGDIVFSEPSGTFADEVSVSLSTPLTGAEIRYRVDGGLPTADSPRYTGEPLTFTGTTELRVQAFVDGAPSGDPGTALYVENSVTTAHDLPLMVMDAYGAGKPGREYEDVATMLMEPEDGTTSPAASPTVATRAGFHLRGQSSASFEKAPYRLELWDNEDDDADHEMLGMPADSDWVLRGPFSDKTLIHDAFVYDLGRDMGKQAPRYEFVELYLNLDGGPLTEADYQGVYMLVETVKESSSRLDLADLDENDVSLPAISGGYIFKFDWMAAEEPTLECTGSSRTCWQYLEVVEPDPLQPEQEAWLTQYIQGFHDALHGPDPADPETGYPAYIDIDSFVDQVILNEISREMDAYIRSTHFYKDRDEKIVSGPLWDYDLTFGTGGYFENQETEGWQFEQTRQPAGSDWFLRLMEDPAFADRVSERWEELRQGVLSDERLADRFAELTEPLVNAAERNFDRWPNLDDRRVGPFLTPTAATWQGQVDYMRDWLAERIAWLDSSGWDPEAG